MRSGDAGLIVTAGVLAIGSRGGPAPPPGRPAGSPGAQKRRVGDGGFRRGLLPSGQPHGRPSLFRCSPSPLFFIDGETEAQRAELDACAKARGRSREQTPPPAASGVPPCARGVLGCLSPGGRPPGGRLPPAAEGAGGAAGRGRRALMTSGRGAPSDRSRQGRRVRMTSRSRSLSDGGHQGAARRAGAWTRPPPRTASPRKCPSTGRPTISSR